MHTEMISTWVEQAQQGDDEAFVRLIRHCEGLAAGYALSLLGDQHLAEDAVQEALLNAYQKLRQLRGPAAFPAWLRLIVRKQCDRLTRRIRAVCVTPDALREHPAPVDSPLAQLLQDETLSFLRLAMTTLDEEKRLLVLLHYWSGFSHEEIGAFLDLPKSTVNNRLHALRASLKERMTTMDTNPQDQTQARSFSSADVVAFLLGMAKKMKQEKSMIGLLGELEHETPSPAMHEVIVDINQRIQSGSSLYQALSRHPRIFPSTVLWLVDMGERFMVSTRDDTCLHRAVASAAEWLQKGSCSIRLQDSEQEIQLTAAPVGEGGSRTA